MTTLRSYWQAPTTVAQGALSGGGWIKRMSMSDDGTTQVVTYDVGGGWIWNASATPPQWQLLCNQTNLPPGYSQTWGEADIQLGTGGAYTQAHLAAVAPSLATTIYVAAEVLNRQSIIISGVTGTFQAGEPLYVSGATGPFATLVSIVNSTTLTTTGGGVSVGATITGHTSGATATVQFVNNAFIFKSTNRAQSWTDTTFSTSYLLDVRGRGPSMVVDPNNPNVMYCMNSTGQVFRTLEDRKSVV